MAVSVPVYKVVAPRFALWTTRSTLTLGVKGGIEGRAHGCRLGADGLGDRARYGRPAGRAALARSRARCCRGVDGFYSLAFLIYAAAPCSRSRAWWTWWAPWRVHWPPVRVRVRVRCP